MTEEQIGKNVEHVKAEIAQAAGGAGRDPAEILLVAATKMNDASAVRAAVRAGVQQALIPDDNLQDLEDVPEEVRSRLQITPVKTIDDVLRETGLALPDLTFAA